MEETGRPLQIGRRDYFQGLSWMATGRVDLRAQQSES